METVENFACSTPVAILTIVVVHPAGEEEVEAEEEDVVGARIRINRGT